MLKLFYAPGTCSLASHIALEEAGADYEARRVDFSTAEQTTPDYLAVNPKGRVPALLTDRGVITETPAILTYIAETHPAANLAPRGDAFAFAQVQSFMNYLCSTVHVAHAHARRGARWADDPAAHEAMKAKVASNMAACFELIEGKMFEGPFVLGETYSVADPYLFTIAGWLEPDGVDPARFPKILDHRNRMTARPAVARVLAVLKA
ncbi:glutathione S-transferase N-terminal domain-containing protein [Ensifer adhaerens]|uniref:glutathione S-transferase family protein n=1 Tax=Ensifer adhaerens TaxID=106592 RepID=UPI001CBDFA77|nr:glutathione S-transferase N-terminal domain-containing protein [Ensifer adhaerens]MBZ7920808.1 glutathione S-transferase N-terminal domain-containing protein [Ensifer adhaerens]UAX93262.1 glutathione S-transferase N-terminal domain-containing protein [Ensifer adhaerens]UAY00899.1 glutathione S-transferase N-terminal domain-containing protein [Ensifer adhaerens]UAY08280.1 glutathione S-transferase N-terminal domain-containing protein [Ensifer adhaerens]